MAKSKLTLEQKKELCRKEINRVAKKLRKSPTKIEYSQSKGTKLTYGQIVYIFGTWNAAIHDAGLPMNLYRLPPSNEITKEQLVEDFIQAANTVGQMPTFRDFSKLGKYSLTPFVRHFKSWNAVKEYVYDNYREELKFAPPKILPGRKRKNKKQE
ncbi:MAG: hypothetical protein PF489_05800 [Salinivirgaceae bacterium]|jgi:hypothetical protein|nr:hypothetical protein [Salinivirgaceae bacterium]